MREELKKYLEEHGLSKEQFAEKAQVSYQNIYRFLAGGNATEATLQKIASAMGKQLEINLREAA